MPFGKDYRQLGLFKVFVSLELKLIMKENGKSIWKKGIYLQNFDIASSPGFLWNQGLMLRVI